MRIIGQIDHPTIKISVFKMDQRISVKFENAGYEQTYKLGDDERFASLEAVNAWVDADLLDRVLELFQNMHLAKMAAMGRAFPANQEIVFEEII